MTHETGQSNYKTSFNRQSMNSEKMDEFKAAFEQDGYVFIPGFFNTGQIAEVNRQLDHIIHDVLPARPDIRVAYEDQNDPQTLKQVLDLNEHSDFFHGLMVNSDFTRVAETLLGEKVIGKNVEFFNKPARVGKETPPHQDAYYFSIKPKQAVTLWLALEDVDMENGCVSYVTGSHTKGMRTHGRSKTVGFSQSIVDFGTEEDMASLVSFPAKPGDLLIHHCMAVHTAGANTTDSRSRKALGLVYWGESVTIDTEAKEAYMKSLQAQKI